MNTMTKILLVDDDLEILSTYRKFFEQQGNIVTSATNGIEAVALLNNNSYDVIFSDISMPKMDGLTFLRSVREKDIDVPVILMTGGPELKSAVDAVHYGAFQYLIKPISAKTLSETLERAKRYHGLAKLKRKALLAIGENDMWLGDLASLEVAFTKALESLWMVFQPIVSWKTRGVFAFEALVRCSEPTLANPNTLLRAAERLGTINELGRTIREYVSHVSSQAPAHAKLFVNLHSLDLNDEELFLPSSPLSKIADRVVLEITERASLDAVKDVRNKVAALRRMGFDFAVDDLGAGYAGLTSLAHLEPEIVKLDISLVRGIDTFPNKQHIVHSLVTLCKDLGMQVITEGVETIAERDTLVSLGCDLFQGYLFAKPNREFLQPNL